MCQDSTSCFDDFCIARPDAHRFWQQFNQARIHAGQNHGRAAAVLRLGSFKLLKLLIFHEILVMDDHAFEAVYGFAWRGRLCRL